MDHRDDELTDDGIFYTVAALQARLFSKAAEGWGTPSLSDYNAWQHWRRKGAATAKPERRRRPRKPTLASVAKQVSKAGIEVARYEVDPDGKIIVVTGKPDGANNTEGANEWDTIQ
jgi:hypothetical protein